MSSGKLILLLIAMGMVGLVLLLGYKLDKYEEKGKRKEKITKKRHNEENEDSYADFKSLKNDYEDEMNQTSTFGNSSFDFNKEISKNDRYLEEFDKTAVIERIDLSKLEKVEEDIEDTSYENEYEEPEFETNLDEELEDEIYEEFEEEETYEAYDYENSNSSTMVFDTVAVNEELEAIGNVKGYDFEEDIETTKKEEEKPKTIRKTATKKTTTKKATTKKTEAKPKTTRKNTEKKAEGKSKTTKKTTTKKTDDKVKKTRAVSVRKEAEKKAKEIKEKNNEKKTKTTARKTTKKSAKSTKTNTKK